MLVCGLACAGLGRDFLEWEPQRVLIHVLEASGGRVEKGGQVAIELSPGSHDQEGQRGHQGGLRRKGPQGLQSGLEQAVSASQP
jgi:hypothetical protein